jgi:hypothetical protein
MNIALCIHIPLANLSAVLKCTIYSRREYSTQIEKTAATVYNRITVGVSE